MTKERFEYLCRKHNVYRTKRHIVAQRIGWVTDDENGNYTLGINYRFTRTPETDALYDECLAGRTYPEGRKLRMDETVTVVME